HAIGWDVNQEHAIATLAGETSDEFSFVNEQVALENGIGDGANHAQFERAPILVGVVNGIADFFVESPFEGIGVRDSGDFGDFIRFHNSSARQQEPRVRLYASAVTQGESARQSLRLHAKESWFLRAI